MHRLLSILLIFFRLVPVLAQTPHGDELKIECSQCHNPDGWTIINETVQFDHDKTNFKLEGTHIRTDCKQCHVTLVFNETPLECISCHSDIHSMTVGNDCARCHTSKDWLVDHIPELHEENGFPLIGAHGSLSCVDCHLSENNVIFNRIGNECISCHRNDYAATQNPNHEMSGFSTNCIECHDLFGTGWDSENINHNFFPLTSGHNIQDCNQCHITGNFSDASPDCVGCHRDDYDQTNNPNHQAANFPTDCVSCHTTNPGWIPATFDHDGRYFPIYSGEHEGEWNDCIDCHANSNNYSEFSCFKCHTKPDMDDKHKDENGYDYVNSLCLQCHPDGSE